MTTKPVKVNSADKKITRLEILELLEKLQRDTADIKLTIGWVDYKGMVTHNAIVIHDCPPIIIHELADRCSYNISMVKGGLLISCDE